MKELYEFALEIARKAGDITLDYFEREMEVERKIDASPVTVADRRAEEFLREQIENRYPQDEIFGEEFGLKEGSSGIRWTLDPIDGTKTFIRGVPLYGTMIAVEIEGRSRIGVIRYPPLGQTLGAYEGGGCWLEGERCRVSEQTEISAASALFTAADTFIKHLGEEALLRLIRLTQFQRTWGDCYGYLLVATGRADFMIDPVMETYDLLPLIPILEEAGGHLSDLNDHVPTEGTIGIVGSNGKIHASVLELLRGV